MFGEALGALAEVEEQEQVIIRRASLPPAGNQVLAVQQVEMAMMAILASQVARLV